MPEGVVFAVAGAKGGVGKTTTSINLSAVLARLGHSVVLVELDVAMANVGDFLDLDVRLEHGRDPTLHDVLAGTADVTDAIYEAPGGFDVLPSGTTLEGFAKADIDRAGSVVAGLRSRYGVVVLDTGAGLGAETVLPLSLADETILVSSPRVASVRDTSKTRDLVRHADGTVAGVVFVKSGTGRSPGVDRIAEFLAVDLLGHVPEDAGVPDAQDIGRPAVVAESDSKAAKAYGALGSRIHERIGALRAARATAETEAGAEAEAKTETDVVDSAEGDDAGPTETTVDDDDGGEVLSTGDGETGGFEFVADDGVADATSGSVAADATDGSDPEPRRRAVAAGVDTPLDESSNVRSGSAAQGSSTARASGEARNGSEDRQRGQRGDPSAGTDTDTAGLAAGETDRPTSSDVEPGRRPAGSRRGERERRRVGGATDDEIAERLAMIEAEAEAEAERETARADEPGREDDEPRATPDAVDVGAEAAGEDGSLASKGSATKRFIDRAIELVDRRGD